MSTKVAESHAMKQDFAGNMLARQFAASESAADYAIRYVGRVTELFKRIDHNAVAQTVAAIEEAASQRKTVYCIANGGSAAVASNLVNDLSPSSLAAGHRIYRDEAGSEAGALTFGRRQSMATRCRPLAFFSIAVIVSLLGFTVGCSEEAGSQSPRLVACTDDL